MTSALASRGQQRGIAPWSMPNSSTRENSVPLARCMVIATGWPDSRSVYEAPSSTLIA